MRHLDEDELVLLFYGEGDTGVAADHVRSCGDCRDAYERLQRVLAAVDDAQPVPERGADYGRNLVDRLRPRLEESRDVPWAQRLRPLLALAAMLAVAFLLGRVTAPPEVVEREVPGPARERVLLVAVGDHLDRSRMVLVELSHVEIEGAGGVNLALERDRAQELVSDNRLYRQTAERAGQRGVATVLDELERVLLEIANGPETLSRGELAELVGRIESGGILFKVRVLGNQVRERQRALVRGASQT